ncbi:MAG: MBL fold metallo-hydrolase [Bacillota bacterium]|nr:MBL fold metallo-hydrolase [Bacillota bacterium]
MVYLTDNFKANHNNLIVSDQKVTYRIIALKAQKGLKNYSYIIVDSESNHAAIIDPAWELDGILETLYKYHAELKAILLTHSHSDHTNLVEPLYSRFDPKVFISPKEMKYCGFNNVELAFLNDMDIIMLGNTKITAIASPGHTDGGLCYLLSDSLFTGDTIFIEGCGMCTSDGGDPGQMYETINRIKSMVKPEVAVYPGHSYGKKPGYTLGYLCAENIYFLFDDKEMFINYRTRNNQTNLFSFK